jgi:hypothetical protein
MAVEEASSNSSAIPALFRSFSIIHSPDELRNGHSLARHIFRWINYWYCTLKFAWPLALPAVAAPVA